MSLVSHISTCRCVNFCGNLVSHELTQSFLARLDMSMSRNCGTCLWVGMCGNSMSHELSQSRTQWGLSRTSRHDDESKICGIYLWVGNCGNSVNHELSEASLWQEFVVTRCVTNSKSRLSYILTCEWVGICGMGWQRRWVGGVGLWIRLVASMGEGLWIR